MGTLNLRIISLAAGLLAASASPFGVVQAVAQSHAQGGNMALVAQVASRLGQTKGVRAQFTQTQTLSAMAQPLVSTGALVFLRERGVIWRMDTPYRASYVISDVGVSEFDANGKRITAKNLPSMQGVAQVSKMMRAMLGGDLSALYSQFDVDAQGTPAQWKLELKPNQPQLAQSIKGLQMSGGEFLATLRITFANGDITRIDFAKSEPVTDLAPDERALLGMQ